jgi:hypothetical protein
MTTKRTKIEYTHTQFHGGFIAYFKLTVQIWNQFFVMSSTFNLLVKIYLALILTIKSFWWVFLKPFWILFSSKTLYVGIIDQVDGIIKEPMNVKKTKIEYFLKIPFFRWTTKNLNSKDVDYIIGKIKGD